MDVRAESGTDEVQNWEAGSRNTHDLKKKNKKVLYKSESLSYNNI